MRDGPVKGGIKRSIQLRYLMWLQSEEPQYRSPAFQPQVLPAINFKRTKEAALMITITWQQFIQRNIGHLRVKTPDRIPHLPPVISTH